MTEFDFCLKDLLLTLRRFWLFGLILCLAGGLAAYIFGQNQPEIYEGQISIPVSFRAVLSGEIKEYQKDAALLIVFNAVDSDPILNRVIKRLAEKDLEMTEEMFVEKTTVMMSHDHIVLSAADVNSTHIEMLLQIWGDEAFLQLQDWVEEAKTLGGKDNLKFTCLDENASINQLVCDPSLSELLLKDESQNELPGVDTNSTGIIEALWVGEPANFLVQSHQYNLSHLILAGFLIGFLIYCMILMILFSNRMR
ncbi:MAG: hypothetical protein K8R40_05940 [Anaerolineaceae bacterium]|nr:hypothetical protein [Anaerolineaceae bacterium]